jgi:hypothetical protein
MKKIILNNKGYIFIIALNVIILLTIYLFSFSFNSLTRYRLMISETKRYQAYLNAKSGIILAMKDSNGGKVPFQKFYTLFNNERYQADVTIENVSYEKKEGRIKIIPNKTGNAVMISSVGKYEKINWTITLLKKGNQQIFFYSE